ncbi:MAG: HU family DNA-binding protein [Oscillospiraceae bacterium]|jgi:DNA-binding protein HU-beta|nr:HU family DNA-binding protein [Oscillospiraceae bacterium]
MNKTELMVKISETTGLSKKDSERALEAAIDTIVDSLIAGEKVQLSGFGIFDVKDRAARIGRNPKTKEIINIPPTKIPQFKPGKALRDVIASSK